jgi:hypothetical protein
VLVVPTAIIIPTAAATLTPTSPPPIPSATSLPPNPAAITPAAVFTGFWRGALVVGLLVLAFSALVRRHR